MLNHRFTLAAALVASALPLLAQSPQERIQSGFKSLSTGSWESALKEWVRDGIWSDADGKLLAKLEGSVSGPRSIGHWEPVNLPHLTLTWQRHWMLASFDQGALFFQFDFMLHKGQWRLVALSASQDPRELLPHLDLLPSLLAAQEKRGK
jgi:hypothetical protein